MTDMTPRINDYHQPPRRFPRLARFLVRLRNRHFLVLDIGYLLLVPLLALALRLESLTAVQSYRWSLLVYTCGALGLRIVLFFLGGLYARYWRYASIDELVQITATVLSSTVLLLIANQLAYAAALPSLPRFVPVLDGLLVLSLVGASRFSVRLAAAWLQPAPNGDAEAVIVMGAGDAGTMITRELRKNSHLGMDPVAFLDDDPEKQNTVIHGLPVLGNRHDIPRVAKELGAGRIILAMPTAPGKEIREIMALCEQAHVETQMIPGFYELLDGTVRVEQLRNVEIEDLLRREPVHIDQRGVRALLHRRRVLITGAGGSIGGELCRQVCRHQPAEVVLLGHGENSIFAIHHELKKLFGDTLSIIPVIADVRFPERLQAVFETYEPQIVFHAAAHKHVPLMEMNPAEAVTNNVQGTKNLLETSLRYDVERFVMISTDKAVNPTSVMGASKRLAELLVHQAAQRSGRPYVAVRFGNVLGSRGSVVLTFEQQIKSGGPVTVTDPEMTRYFMTIPEAVQLVLQAAVLGAGDEVFVLDMGAPVKILDLAKDMIELSGLEVGRDIDIVFTGRRPGEKLFEELFGGGEDHTVSSHNKIFIAQQATNGGDGRHLERQVGQLVAAASRGDQMEVRHLLKELIPEYQCSELSADSQLRPSLLQVA